MVEGLGQNLKKIHFQLSSKYEDNHKIHKKKLILTVGCTILSNRNSHIPVNSKNL